jgi:hypothetical protein
LFDGQVKKRKKTRQFDRQSFRDATLARFHG